MNTVNNSSHSFETPFMDAFDFKSLVNNKALSESEKVNVASQQFEAIFIKQIIANGMKPVLGEQSKDKNLFGITSNSYNETFLPEIISQRLAAEGIFGLNDALADSFN